jgi:hypothetical protein
MFHVKHYQCLKKRLKTKKKDGTNHDNPNFLIYTVSHAMYYSISMLRPGVDVQRKKNEDEKVE